VPQAGNATPASELRLRPALRYALRYRGQVFPIQGTVITLGRNLDCDVVLSGPLVSRVHARLLIDSEGVNVEDLLSRNGVAVDGVLIDRPRRIEPGARLRLGDETVELLAERVDRSTRPVPTNRPSEKIAAVAHQSEPEQRVSTSDSTAELTHHADLFDLLGASVERAFDAKNGDEVERLIGRHLERLVDQARIMRHIDDEVFGRAALYAIRLAVTTNKPTWFDYVVRLYTTLSIPLPLPIVDQLSAHIRRVPGISRQQLREYVAKLRNEAGLMSAERRFRLQRVESLERLVSL
jgi:pSer/pThr/pTyr-binding forkhead associated (FHA) protein